MPRKGMSVTADKVFSLAREDVTLCRILLLDMYYGHRGSRGRTTRSPALSPTYCGSFCHLLATVLWLQLLKPSSPNLVYW